MEKRLSKNTLYSKNDKILKSGKNDYSVAKAIETELSKMACFGTELLNSKKIRKSTLEPHYICFRQETALKSNLYSKIYKTLKSGKNFVLL